MKTTNLVLLFLGFGLGFTIGNLTGAETASVSDNPEIAALRARVAELTRTQRTGRQSDANELRGGARVAMPASSSANTEVALDAKADGSTGATQTAPSQTVSAKSEPANPERAAELLASVETALSAGDADALQGLARDLAGQSELMVPDLVNLLRNAESLFAKEHLAQTLGQLQDPRALPALRDLLKAEDNDAVRTAVVRALGLIPDVGSVPLLAVEFGRPSSSPMPASLAATSLGNIGSPEAITALKNQILTGKNGMVRAFAMRALAAQESKGLVPFFVEQARRQDVSDRYRKSAIDAIVAAGDKASVDQLRIIAMSPDSGRSVQEAAKRAVNKLSGRKVFEVR